jgi:GNAT superfamily N-acetyltransferase
MQLGYRPIIWLAFLQDGRHRPPRSVICASCSRAATDGILCASISLLEVVPQYQHQGIGNQLVRRMLKDLGPLYAIDLTCDPALAEFYQRFDFTPWHGMIQRNYQQQSGCCESQGETT